MANVSLTSQQILAQTLAQLNNATHSQAKPKISADVLVHILGNNQLSIQNSKSTRSLVLPKADASGAFPISSLSSGKPYLAVLEPASAKNNTKAKTQQATLNLYDSKPAAGETRNTPIAKFHVNQAQVKELQSLLSFDPQNAKPASTRSGSNLAPAATGHQADIQNMLRFLNAKAENPSQNLAAIEDAVRDVSMTSSSLTKALLTQIAKQSGITLTTTNRFDVESIKQLLSPTSINLSATQLFSAQPNAGLIAGLVRLIQLTLTAKTANTQANKAEFFSQLVGSILTKVQPITKSQASNSMNELRQLDDKHQLLRQLASFLAQHQLAKLQSAEQTFQGQDTLYYVFPSANGNVKHNIEVLIKKEQQDQAKTKDKTANNKVWQLSMKLPLGDLGDGLAKVKLNQNELEIDFYTSTEQLKSRIVSLQPLLIKRLEALGLQIKRAQCQMGKIPESLCIRPYQLFETQA